MRIYQKAADFATRVAVYADERSYTYADLLESADRITCFLLHQYGVEDLQEERIAFIVAPGFNYVAVQWGIWQAGGIAVPLCPDHPPPSIAYYLEAVESSSLIYNTAYLSIIEALSPGSGIRMHNVEAAMEQDHVCSKPNISPDRSAMILFTSGTTSKPKGVVTTHRIIESQIQTLISAWEWSKDDVILNVLPLHHVHGIINILSCSLWAGASCKFLPSFTVGGVWREMVSDQLTLFMAVPTIYYKLIDYWSQQPQATQRELSNGAGKLRLMVSGSAALPVGILHQWHTITGHTLLERYGMTEIGMALSNPYHGERKPGHVGLPLPGVELRLVGENNALVTDNGIGEIQVRGPNVFREYWRNPKATQDAFADGWFKTGDVAVYQNGSYKILGRNSVDIIKSGGYKISALEIEEVLRTHEAIAECAVVGILNEEWGEIVSAAIVAIDAPPTNKELKDWMKDRLPPYQVPRRMIWLKTLPRNTLGKVTKKAIITLFQQQNENHGLSH